MVVEVRSMVGAYYKRDSVSKTKKEHMKGKQMVAMMGLQREASPCLLVSVFDLFGQIGLARHKLAIQLQEPHSSPDLVRGPKPVDLCR